MSSDPKMDTVNGSNGVVGQSRKRGRHSSGSDHAPLSVASAAPPPRKRGRKPALAVERVTLILPPGTSPGGPVLCLGTGDTGQLGLGEDILERRRPAVAKVEGEKVRFRRICAGGMHTAAITQAGEVYTFGCNDEGALGRPTPDDEACYLPGRVELPGDVGRFVQVCAGDSFTVVLSEQGKAFYWGTFRDSSGSFGLTAKGMEMLPVPLAPHLDIKKIAAGSDHIVLLTQEGHLYSLGCAEQGQIGRVGQRFVARGGRRGVKLLHSPELVLAKNRKAVFVDVWAGSYSTYVLTDKNEVFVCGLNNYNQLGIAKGQMFHTLVKSSSFSRLAVECGGWMDIAPGQHHALALDGRGRVHAIGRMEYGRLGLGEQDAADAKVPTLLTQGLPEGQKVVAVSCGTAVSFAVTEDGRAYSWGMGTNGQLSHEDEDTDAWTPSRVLGKQLENRKVVSVAGGGQHTVLLALDKN